MTYKNSSKREPSSAQAKLLPTTACLISDVKEAGEVKRGYEIYKHFKASNSFQEIKLETNLNAISKKDLATLWNNAPRAAFSRGARATFEGCNFDLQTENIMKGVIPMKKMILGDFNGRSSALFYVIETRDFFFTVVIS